MARGSVMVKVTVSMIAMRACAVQLRHQPQKVHLINVFLCFCFFFFL